MDRAVPDTAYPAGLEGFEGLRKSCCCGVQCSIFRHSCSLCRCKSVSTEGKQEKETFPAVPVLSTSVPSGSSLLTDNGGGEVENGGTLARTPTGGLPRGRASPGSGLPGLG